MTILATRGGAKVGTLMVSGDKLTVDGDAELRADVDAARSDPRGGWADVTDYVPGPIRGASDRAIRATIEAVSHRTSGAYRFTASEATKGAAKGTLSPLLDLLDAL